MVDNQCIVTSGYQALQQNCAFVDASNRGRIRVTGEDRARLLHALATNHVQGMKPGDELYAFFLTAQGRIVSDAHILCYEDHFLVDVEPEARAGVFQHIDHYIIADDVALQDVTESTYALLAGGKRFFGPLEAKAAAIASLALPQATEEDARLVRIERFQPRFGEDIMSATLPQETGLTHALHFNKGCYLGQEIVERIRSRGHVNKVLRGLAFEAGTVPEPGTKVEFEGAEAGHLTSSAQSPLFGGRAIALLRVQAAEPGAVVHAAGLTARVALVS